MLREMAISSSSKAFATFGLTLLIVAIGVASSSSQSELSSADSCHHSTTPIEKNLTSIISVGIISAIVFALVGILPSVFIRTDADEARFGKTLLFIFFKLMSIVLLFEILWNF